MVVLIYDACASVTGVGGLGWVARLSLLRGKEEKILNQRIE
jgi:hypothetical protein